MKRFGSVSVLNGHIHQVMQKVEGNVTFHTAMSTAFPQPQPGTAPSPGPMKVPAEKLRGLLGVTDVNFVRGNKTLAVVDSTLALAEKPKQNSNNSIERINEMKKTMLKVVVCAVVVAVAGWVAGSRMHLFAAAKVLDV